MQNEENKIEAKISSPPVDDKKLALESRVYCFVDVDDTLIRSRTPDHKVLAVDYDKIKIDHGLEAKFLNLDLIYALSKSNITDLFLFTDMRHSAENLKERLALITSLRKRNVIVRAVITPSDYVWHYLDDKQIHAFFSCQSREEQDKLFDVLLAECRTALTLPPKTPFEPGIAFNIGIDAKLGLDPDAKKRHRQKCDLAKCIIDSLAAERRVHNKGLLYEQFLRECAGDFSQFFVMDDRDDVLESVGVMHQQQRQRASLLTPMKINLNKSPVDSYRDYCRRLSLSPSSFAWAPLPREREEKLTLELPTFIILTSEAKKMVSSGRSHAGMMHPVKIPFIKVLFYGDDGRNRIRLADTLSYPDVENKSLNNRIGIDFTVSVLNQEKFQIWDGVGGQGRALTPAYFKDVSVICLFGTNIIPLIDEVSEMLKGKTLTGYRLRYDADRVTLEPTLLDEVPILDAMMEVPYHRGNSYLTQLLRASSSLLPLTEQQVAGSEPVRESSCSIC